MQRTEALQGEKFLDVIKKIEGMTSSQQRFIQEMLSQRKQVPVLPKKRILKKSFGLWADRGGHQKQHGLCESVARQVAIAIGRDERGKMKLKLEDGVVMLEPNVRKYFPNSEAVNKALRSLIEIIPSKRRA